MTAKKAQSLLTLDFDMTHYLSEYKGISVFMDCDFMWRSNVLELLFFVNPKNAVTVCKHDYTPTGALKMDGQSTPTKKELE